MILDVLVSVGLITLVMVPLMETTRIALTSGSIVKSQITQQDLHQVITKSLSNPSCHKNYEARNNPEKHLKFYETASSTGTNLLSKGNSFKGSLEIVDMVFEDRAGTTNTKKLSIFYKILKVGSYSTRDNKECNSTNTSDPDSGCYFNNCSFEYDSTALTCNLLDCSSSNNSKNTRSAKQCEVGSFVSSIDSNGNIECSAIENELVDCSSNIVDHCKKTIIPPIIPDQDYFIYNFLINKADAESFSWSCESGYVGSCGYSCNVDNKWESSKPNTCKPESCDYEQPDNTYSNFVYTLDFDRLRMKWGFLSKLPRRRVKSFPISATRADCYTYCSKQSRGRNINCSLAVKEFYLYSAHCKRCECQEVVRNCWNQCSGINKKFFTYTAGQVCDRNLSAHGGIWYDRPASYYAPNSRPPNPEWIYDCRDIRNRANCESKDCMWSDVIRSGGSTNCQ